MVPTFHRDADLQDHADRDELHEMRREIAELHERVDGLVEAIELIAHDHYRPLGLPEARVTSALNRAKRRLTIYVADLRR
jgi:hypothetical protein